jgi:AcrR family transcriptional regulator
VDSDLTTSLTFGAGAGAVIGARLTARGKQTRNRVLASARSVFEVRPYREVRVAQISKHARVAHGTFYTYFDGKESIFKLLVEEMVRDLFEASHGDHHVRDPATRLLLANRRYLEAVQRHSRMFFRLHEAAATDQMIGQWLQHAYDTFYARIAGGLERLQQHGLADPSLPPMQTARALGAMVEGFALGWLREDDPDLETAADVLTRLWCGAVGLRLTAMSEDLRRAADSF